MPWTGDANAIDALHKRKRVNLAHLPTPVKPHNEEGLAAFLSSSAVFRVASSTPLPLLLVRGIEGRQ